MTTHLTLPRVAAALAASLALAACGGSGGSGGSSSTTSGGGSAASAAAPSDHLAIAAQPSGTVAFTKKTMTAKAGTVTISFTNDSPEQHNLTIEQGGRVLGATPTFDGGSRTLTVKLKPGKYTYFCSVPGHREAGMVGTLTVT